MEVNFSVGELIFACLVPHPPIMVPEVGDRETEKVKQTVAALTDLGEALAAAKPDTVIFITPHSLVFSDAVGLVATPRVAGNLGKFRAPQIDFSFDNDQRLIQLISEQARRGNIELAVIDAYQAKRYGMEQTLDHGITAPLYYLCPPGFQPLLVPVAMGMLPLEDLYTFGVCLQEAVALSERRVAIVASGDMSHRLSPEASAGYDPQGKIFDARVQEALRTMEVADLLAIPPELAENAGECGLRPLVMLLGALDGFRVDAKILSYEGPFGVGYLVTRFALEGLDPERKLGARLKEQRLSRLAQIRAQETLPVQLARHTLETYVRSTKIINTPVPLPEELSGRAGVFVSLKKNDQLRGCIGTIAPIKENIADEIIANAISAGTHDPRFYPVEPEELEELVYSVDILGAPEPVAGFEELDPRCYGVIVRCGKRSGLLLPDLPGVNTVAEQVAIAKQKAGINPDEPFSLERFTVTRYT